MFVPHKKIAFSQKRINNVFKNWNHDQNKHRIERLLKYNVIKNKWAFSPRYEPHCSETC